MDTALVRRSHDSLHPLHSMTYFVPETERHLVALGLEAGRMCYFAGRAAPMGAVGAGTVTATFYNFSPTLVAAHIPRAWTLASPAAVVAARFAAADAALRRLLGDDVLAGEDLATAAALAREATAGCAPDGRPMYAAVADLEWPDAPHLVLWHALTLLREHRGDGHIVALVAAGLSGIEAIATHTASGQGFVESFAQASRGWSDDEWGAAFEGLRARGLLEADGQLSAQGRALRDGVEAETDRLAAPPWVALGEAGTERLATIGAGLTARVKAAGAFPDGVFARR